LIAERSIDSMIAAESAATIHKGPDLARVPFSAGTGAKIQAERAFARNDYLQAGRQALAATASFRTAASDAQLAAAAVPNPAPVPPPGPTTETTKSSPAPSEPAPPTPIVAAPPVIAPPKPPELDSAGILGALNRYKSAYGNRNVDAIRKVYPSLPQDESERLRKNFNACRDVNVEFSGMQTSPVAEDPTVAVVTVRSTYFCQPRIKAPAQQVPQEDVFRLRNVNGVWLIDRMGAMDRLR
jgi:hypothetical protein